MYRRHGTIRLTVADLVRHLACQHLTELNLREAQGELDVPDSLSSPLDHLHDHALEHEHAYLEHLEASGVEMVMGAADFFTAEVLERFDVIGFDPRGVGFSEPAFACGEPGEQLALLAAIEPPIDTPAKIAAGEAAANLCIESMGAVGGLLHSEKEQVHQVLIEGNASRRVEDRLRANRRSQLRLARRGREIIFTALIRCDVEVLA